MRSCRSASSQLEPPFSVGGLRFPVESSQPHIVDYLDSYRRHRSHLIKLSRGRQLSMCPLFGVQAFAECALHILSFSFVVIADAL